MRIPNKYKARLVGTGAAIVFLLTTVGVVFGGMQGSSYSVTSTVFATGGMLMSSNSYQLQSTLGQPTPITSQNILPESAAYTINPGFWPIYRASAGCINPRDFGWSFGSVSGGLNYNFSCDFDSDGDVDGVDMAVFTAGL